MVCRPLLDGEKARGPELKLRGTMKRALTAPESTADVHTFLNRSVKLFGNKKLCLLAGMHDIKLHQSPK